MRPLRSMFPATLAFGAAALIAACKRPPSAPAAPATSSASALAAGSANAAAAASATVMPTAVPSAGAARAEIAPPKAPARPPRFARIDVHTHIGPEGITRAQQLGDKWGIDGFVNLSGMYPGPPRQMLETQLEAAQKTSGRIAVFVSPDFMRALRLHRDYGRYLADQLVEAKRLGAIGVKISKGLGLGYPTADFKNLLRVDDPGLDPMFAKAGELGLPIAIHTGDPKAFWQKVDKSNERWDELGAHPEWAFAGLHPELKKPWPKWEELYAQFERRVARHPKTTFIGLHFGNAPEEPDRVARMLDKYSNLYIDTAARVPEIGRHDADKMRRFYEKYQDRVLFGTDTGIGEAQDEMMYGSSGDAPPTLRDEERFFTATWRYFETRDKQFEHPTPIQGRWKIDGVGLDEKILRKIYFENAARVLGWKPGLAPEATR
jgi:predicted TIM-barrel fold metal-dependent hydrolase